jgi:MYXO-CTERM domain-containing protein
VTCPSDQYCEAGQCIASCATITCPTGQRCQLGMCQTDPCGKQCPAGQVCNDANGTCIDDPCQFRHCPTGQWCNPNDGMCETDPCVGTMCPADPPGQVCKGGTCETPAQAGTDAGVGNHVTVAGGGCSTGGSSGAGVLVGLALFFVRRRRGGRAS